MIAKGNLHGSGGALAQYLITGDKEESAELLETRGLECFGDDPVQAFETLQQAADANTQSSKPFFHVQIRNPDGDKRLTNERWLQIADRMEKRLGFEGQPRIVSFHIDRESGEKHLHVAWFRIDMETMKAIDPGLYKNHLKQLCRSLEKEYGLQEISSARKPEDIARIADRDEVEEARRLGMDVRQVRNAIHDCLQHTDNGKAFRAALDECGLMLANGDKRDCFVVIDQAGGHHALNKKLTGLTLAQLRDRLSDLDRTQLPGVEQAKAMQQEKYPTPEQAREAQVSGDRQRNAPGRYDELKAEPQQRPEANKGKEQDARPEAKHPAHAPEPAQPEKRVSPTLADIRATWSQSPSPGAFATVMQEQGHKLARVTPDEARESARISAAAKDAGAIAPKYRDGEIVIVNDQGWTYRLTEKSTGGTWADIHKFTAAMKSAELPSIAEAKKAQLSERSRNAAAYKETAWHNRGITNMEVKIYGIQEVADRGGVSVAAGLYAEGLTLARVDAAGRAHVESENKRHYENDRLQGKPNARPHQAPTEGELVAVNKRGMVFRLNPTFIETDRLEHAAMTGGGQTPTLSAAITHFATDRQQQKADRQAAWETIKEARQTTRAHDRVEAAVKSAPGATLRNVKNTAFRVVDAAGKFMSVSSFIESLFGMRDQSAPDDYGKRPRGTAHDDPEKLWEEIYDAAQQGRALPGDAIRHLPPADIENLRSHGDAYINNKILEMETDKKRDEHRSWQDYTGRELERE